MMAVVGRGGAGLLRVQYVHLPNFDVASDAFVTLRDLLTRNKTVASDVSERRMLCCDGCFVCYAGCERTTKRRVLG